MVQCVSVAERGPWELSQSMKRIKILARKNLRMSDGKLAAQCVHAALGLYKLAPERHHSCIVLQVSDKKFEEAIVALSQRLPDLSAPFYVVTDAGYTEVESGTQTSLALYEEDSVDRNT
jgi:peptidyl-tRNA hydrolase, PTH2 family